jgi:hypothetical protein
MSQKIQWISSYPEIDSVFPKPEPATKLIPQWYKDQPAIIGDSDTIENSTLKLTVKKCQAFFDAVALGYMLKLPCDIYIDTTDGKYDIQIPGDLMPYKIKLISQHSKEQVSHYPIDSSIYVDSQVLRVHPNWMVRTAPGYSTLFMPPIHQPSLPIVAVQAVIDTDNFFSDGHLSFFVRKDFKGVLKQGTPFVQVFPFKRDEWESEHIQISDEERKNQRYSVRSVFQNGYRMKHWVKKIFK